MKVNYVHTHTYKFYLYIVTTCDDVESVCVDSLHKSAQASAGRAVSRDEWRHDDVSGWICVVNSTHASHVGCSHMRTVERRSVGSWKAFGDPI